MRRTRGFTFIEVMIVVAIFAVLVLIAFPSLVGTRSQAEQRAATRKFRAMVARARTLAASGSNENYPGWAPTDRTVEAGLFIDPTGYRLFVDRNRVTDNDEIVLEVVNFADLARGSNYADTLQINSTVSEIRFQRNGTLRPPNNVDVEFTDTKTGLVQTVAITFGGSTRVN